MGKLEVRQIRQAVRKLSGHCRGSPSDVAAQSSSRIRRAISLVPGNVSWASLAFSASFMVASKTSARLR